jgi:hypothetical protein
MLDDNALDPSRNQCSVVISRLFGLVVLEEVACCCIEVVQLGDPVHEQRIVKAMVNMHVQSFARCGTTTHGGGYGRTNQLPNHGCIYCFIMDVVWFLRKVFRTIEYSLDL